MKKFIPFLVALSVSSVLYGQYANYSLSVTNETRSKIKILFTLSGKGCDQKMMELNGNSHDSIDIGDCCLQFVSIQVYTGREWVSAFPWPIGYDGCQDRDFVFTIVVKNGKHTYAFEEKEQFKK